MEGFESGNTRLRARKAGLLGREAFAALAGVDVEGVLGALARTAYRQDVEEALTRGRGLRCLHHALRAHLARSLAELRGFYAGRSRRAIDALLARHELQAVLAVLRGVAGQAPPDEVLLLATPAGGLDEAALRELARQPDPRAVVDLLVVWGLPAPSVARAALDAWPEYARARDLAVLEAAVVRAHGRRLQAMLAQDDPEDAALRDVLLAELDQVEVLAALRRRGAGAAAGVAADAAAEEPRPGRVARRTLQALEGATSREEAALVLAREPRAHAWREPVQRWVADGDLPGLGDALRAGSTRRAVAGFRSGDPLGVAVPIAWVWAKESEARALRLVGSGAPPSRVADELAHLP